MADPTYAITFYRDRGPKALPVKVPKVRFTFDLDRRGDEVLTELFDPTGNLQTAGRCALDSFERAVLASSSVPGERNRER